MKLGYFHELVGTNVHKTGVEHDGFDVAEQEDGHADTLQD